MIGITVIGTKPGVDFVADNEKCLDFVTPNLRLD